MHATRQGLRRMRLQAAPTYLRASVARILRSSTLLPLSQGVIKSSLHAPHNIALQHFPGAWTGRVAVGHLGPAAGDAIHHLHVGAVLQATASRD